MPDALKTKKPNSKGGNRRRGGNGQRSKQNGLGSENPVNRTLYQGSRKANQPTKQEVVKVIALGGLGETGKNTMAIEYGNDIIIVDLGLKFPTEEQPGIDYSIAETTYLEKNKNKLRGLIITHAHEDHVGAVPFSWPKLGVPIFGSRFSLGYIEKKLVEYNLKTPPKLMYLDPDKHERLQLGAFTIELIRVTHAIPDPCAILIKTPVGNIVHTGDWRFDQTPVDNKLLDVSRLEEIGREGVQLLISDAQNCMTPGRTPSENQIEPNILELINKQTGRVIISSFASQINRAQSIINAVHKSGRKLAITGRSMLSNIELSFKLGYVKMPAGLLVKIQDTLRMPDDKVVIFCTGSQGEVNAVLWRMSTGEHPHIKLKSTDSIVFSSSIIPGNEMKLVKLFDQLLREGGKIYHNNTRSIDGHGILHVSGHAYRDEILDMIKWTKPKFLLPVHGDFMFLVRHAELAEKEGGIPRENIIVADNGDVLELTASSFRKNGRVPAGSTIVDSGIAGDVEQVVIRDRVGMSEEGIFMVVATVDRRTGRLVNNPDIVSRGFIVMKENEELINAVRAEIRKFFETRDTSRPTEWSTLKMDLRDRISDFLYLRFKRSPIIIPVINEV